MANYPCNPFAFIPNGLAIDHGPQNRRVRCDLAVSAVPPLNHDNYAITETNLDIQFNSAFMLGVNSGECSVMMDARHARVLVKVWLMGDALVPRSLVLRQMGGQRRAWSIPVYLLRSDQWTAHMHALPVDVEDPPPADGNPHPFHGPHMTAEQRFQQRLQVWLQQNGIFRGPQGAGNAGAATGHVRQAPNSSAFMPAGSLVNYQSILREQGVLFSHGVVPLNNISDSPLNAWNDMMSDQSTESAETLRIITGDSDVAESSAQGAARAMMPYSHDDDEVPTMFMIARTVLINMQEPNLYIYSKSLFQNALPPINLLKTVLSDGKEVYDKENSVRDRRVARKLCFDDSPASDSAMVLYDHSESTKVILVQRGRKETVQVSSAVRRSLRNNIYKGFKVNMPTDSRKRKSKVAARIVPEASSTPPKDIIEPSREDSPTIPPPTPISILQKIGVNICGIPPEELEKDKLEKKEDEGKE
ncbi:hypothetical protein ACQ4PT_006447 [Festuca glaucescens]